MNIRRMWRRRKVIVPMVLAGVLMGTTIVPASAQEYAQACQYFYGVGSPSGNVQVCAYVNAHSFLDNIAAVGKWSNVDGGGIGGASLIYIDWVVLQRNGTTVRRVDPDQSYSVLWGWSTGSTDWYPVTTACEGAWFRARMRYKLQYWGSNSWTGFYTVVSGSTHTYLCD